MRCCDYLLLPVFLCTPALIANIHLLRERRRSQRGYVVCPVPVCPPWKPVKWGIFRNEREERCKNDLWSRVSWGSFENLPIRRRHCHHALLDCYCCLWRWSWWWCCSACVCQCLKKRSNETESGLWVIPPITCGPLITISLPKPNASNCFLPNTVSSALDLEFFVLMVSLVLCTKKDICRNLIWIWNHWNLIGFESRVQSGVEVEVDGGGGGQGVPSYQGLQGDAYKKQCPKSCSSIKRSFKYLQTTQETSFFATVYGLWVLVLYLRYRQRHKEDSQRIKSVASGYITGWPIWRCFFYVTRT